MLVCDKFSDQVIKSVCNAQISFFCAIAVSVQVRIVQKYSGVFLVEASFMVIIIEKDYKDFQQQFCWLYSFAVLQNVA